MPVCCLNIFNLIIDYNGNTDAMVVFSDILNLSVWPISRPPRLSDLEIFTTSGCFVVMKENSVKRIYEILMFCSKLILSEWGWEKRAGGRD